MLVASPLILGYDAITLSNPLLYYVCHAVQLLASKKQHFVLRIGAAVGHWT